MLRHRATN